MENIELDFDEQVRIRREKLLALQKSGNDPFQIVKFDKTHNSMEILSNYDVMEGKDVAVAGRIVLKRIMGKASFVHILDEQGKIQVYIAVNDIGETLYDQFKDWGLGDIIGINGHVFKTKTGEISVHAKTVILLAKSLKPLPDKYHGLKDPEMRYRERYVDLIVNPEVRNIFITRTKIIKAIREFLDNRGFLEVDTPILESVPGGAEARPFITHHNTMNMPMYLRIATELHLKRLIVGGFEKVYEMGRIFRNEGVSYKHNPEFTSIELYQAYTDYEGMMELTESLVKFVMQKVLGTTVLNYEGHTVDFGKPWKRVRMFDIAKDYKDFDENIEPTIIEPTFVTGYPVEISPLAKKEKGNPKFVERFELFAFGRELANAYSELNDPIDQRERFAEQMAQRAKGNDEAHMQDDDFLNAMDYAMPPTGGMGMGVDRLIMMLTGVHSIRECLLFPTMKPIATKKISQEGSKNFELVIDKNCVKNFEKVSVGVLELDIKPNSTFKNIENCTKEILAQAVKNASQIAKWKKVFSDMGMSDKKSSVVFLTETLQEKGKLFNIHPIVDFYNAISVKYGIPMAAYDADKIVGSLKLRGAKSGETFIGIGGKVTEPTDEKEIVYADDQGIICRHWNYKDSDRTKITKSSKRIVILFDGINDTNLIKSAQNEMLAMLKDFNCNSYIVEA